MSHQLCPDCDSPIKTELPKEGGGWVTYTCPQCGDSHELIGDEEAEQGREVICGDCLYPLSVCQHDKTGE